MGCSTLNVGIVGHESAKFTEPMYRQAFTLICSLLLQYYPNAILVSGGCHLGGVDKWAEEAADSLSISKIVHLPRNLQWSTGYKPRNLKIAKDSDIVHVIVVEGYHKGYTGMRFDSCYHCHTNNHVKSGACWTARQAMKLGKQAVWHVVPVIEPSVLSFS